jgi:hypothetical protein
MGSRHAPFSYSEQDRTKINGSYAVASCRHALGLRRNHLAGSRQRRDNAFRGAKLFAGTLLLASTPAERWRDVGKNCLDDMRVVGHAQLVRNRQQ